MPQFIAQLIHRGVVTERQEFEAEADPMRPGDTDIKAAYREQGVNIDPYSGRWVNIQKKSENEDDWYIR